MRHIDIVTLKELHNALDDITLGNFGLAHKQLTKLVNSEYVHTPINNDLFTKN